MKVGFVGLGNMGAPLARLIAAGGMELSVFDPHPAAVASFGNIARIAASPADAATAVEIVGVCVRDDAQAQDAICGSDGILAGMTPGGILLIHSTIQPRTLFALSDAAGARGVTLLDAPVSRTESWEDRPFVFTMTGGEAAAAERAQPVLRCFSTDTMHVGRPGSALTLKICNNGVTWVELLLGWQICRIAEAAGVPFECLATVMRRNGNLTPAMDKFLSTQHQFAPGENPSFDAMINGQIGIGEKDLQLAIDLSAENGITLDMAVAARAMVTTALGR